MIVPLQTWQWALSSEAAELRASLSPEPTISHLTRLRERWTPEQVAVVSELVSARAKAIRKFSSRGASIVADRAGVEMASSARSAAHKAARFLSCLGPNAPVLDACCGIGGDTMALADAGLRVTALDLDECRAWMAGTNASCRWIAADFLSYRTEVPAVHIDPARRSGDTRSRDPEEFEPPLSEIVRSVEGRQLVAIKLNPGVDAYALPNGEVEILSEPGGLTQAVLWVGALAGEISRRATMIGDAGVLATIGGDPERPEDSTAIGSYIGTLDPCLERADLVGVFLDEVGVSLVHPGTGLVTSEKATPHAMVRWYRVLETLPWNEKRVRAVLRDLGAGIVEIRTRAGVVNPDELQRRLRGDGDRQGLSVLVYRLGDRVVAVVAESVPTKEPAGAVSPAGSDGGF